MPCLDSEISFAFSEKCPENVSHQKQFPKAKETRFKIGLNE